MTSAASGDPLKNAVQRSTASFGAKGLRILGRLLDASGATDIALANTAPNSIVVRCVNQARPADYRDLATMLREGDFDRAVLVYCDPKQPDLSDQIESWPIARIDELAASLASTGRT